MTSKVICDIDGCVAIYPEGFPVDKIKAGELTWDEAYQTAVPNYPLCRILNYLPRDKLVFLTSRWKNAVMLPYTEDFLRKQCGFGDKPQIIMRDPIPQGQPRPSSAEYKTEIIKQIGVENIWFCIEDNNGVVEAYRELGILTLQPDNAEFY